MLNRIKEALIKSPQEKLNALPWTKAPTSQLADLLVRRKIRPRTRQLENRIEVNPLDSKFAKMGYVKKA